MSDAQLTVAQLEQEIDALSAEIERAQDRGVTVMPEKTTRLAGLRKLLEAKRTKNQHAGAND